MKQMDVCDYRMHVPCKSMVFWNERILSLNPRPSIVQKYLISILERKTRVELNVKTLKTILHVSKGLVTKKRCSSSYLWRFSIQSTTVEGRGIPGSWWEALANRTWLWWPCRSRRGPAWRGVRVWACWHRDWKGQGRSNHPVSPQPPWRDEMTWPSGRTTQTFDL